MAFNVLRAEEKIMIALRELYSSFGYMQYKVSKFEEYDLYVQNKSFLASEQILTFSDTNGKLMALKPDITLSIIKNTKDEDVPRKVYYTENVYRVPRGAYGFQEIMQTGLECIGAVDTYSLCEVLMLAAKSLEVISERFLLELSDMRILCGILDDAGVEEDGRRAILRAFGEKNAGGLAKACGGCGLSGETEALLQSLLKLAGPLTETLTALMALPLPESCRGAAASLAEIGGVLTGQGVGNVHLDFSVVNDTDYYNGLIFRGFVDGIPTGVLSGGRYDSLAARMGKSSGAVGFAVYFDQLERFREESSAYDTDVLIVYNGESDCGQVAETAAGYRGQGKTVRVQQKIDGIRYRELVNLTGRA